MTSIDDTLNDFMSSIDKKTAAILMDMSKLEDWTVGKDDPEYQDLIDYMGIFLAKPDIRKNSYLATQLLGWVSAPQCLMLIKDLSESYPSLIRSIFLLENNNDITRMVVERLSVLERHSYLRRMLDPAAIRSISSGIRHYYKQNKELIDA